MYKIKEFSELNVFRKGIQFKQTLSFFSSYSVHEMPKMGFQNEHIKFGKIYVQKKASPFLEQVESVRFSNLDWKWYCPRGERRNFNEQLVKNKTSLQVEIAPEDKHGSKCAFVVNLNLPFVLGEIPSKNMKLFATLDSYQIEFMENYGNLICKEDLANTRIYTKEVVSFTSFVTRSEAKNLRLAMDAFATIFILDDFLESENLKDYQNLHRTIQTWINILIGKDSKLPANIQQGDLESFLEKGKLLCWYLRQQALICAGEKHPEKAHPFFKAFIQFLKGSLVEASREWITKKNTQSIMFQRFQSQLRNETVSAKVLIEAIALSQGLTVKSSIRDSIPFQNFCDLAAEHMAKTNDLFSFEKEFKAGWAANHVSVLHLEKNLPLKDALQQVVDELNDINEILLESIEFLLQVNENEPQLKRYVSLVRDFVAGQIQWHGFSKRYYPSCVFNLVLQDGTH